MSDSVSARYKEALRRGHVAVVKGRPREAVEHYQEAGQLAEQRPLPFVSMGSVFLQMQQPREALAAYDEALRRAPDDLDAMRGRAMALEAAGKVPEARALRTRAAEVEAVIQAGRRVVGAVDPRSQELERHIIAGARARAAGDLDTACAAYLTAANGYSAANDFVAGLDACLRALEARPGNIDVHFTMAVMYLRCGWAELGVQRVELIEHRLDIDDDRRRRAALHALARDHRTMAPELERLAASPIR
jgi:tetratricopeptide (TPR) repeat protein